MHLLGTGGDVEVLVELREGERSVSLESPSEQRVSGEGGKRTEMPPSWFTSTSLMTFWIVCSSTSE